MKRIFLILMLLLSMPSLPVFAQSEGELKLTNPVEGQVIQGLVMVTGTVTVLGFSSYDLSFSYSGDSSQTWFTIHSSVLPVFEGDLGTWDTSTLTDGDYNLRLQVFLLDGGVQQTTISGLRVRNYTAVPTPTPLPTSTAFAPLALPTAQLIVPAAATVTHSLPTPTSLPNNPAGLEAISISNAIGRGAILTLLVFLGLGLILRLRRE